MALSEAIKQRYNSQEFKNLQKIQNHMAFNGPDIDIITITAFMNHDEFIVHHDYYADKHPAALDG